MVGQIPQALLDIISSSTAVDMLAKMAMKQGET